MYKLTYEERREKMIKQFIMIFLSVILAVLLLTLFILWPILHPPGIVIFGIQFIIQLCAVSIVYYLPVSSIRRIFHLYVSVSLVLLFPVTLTSILLAGDMSSCIWYVVTPPAIYIVVGNKNRAYWTIFSFLLLVLAFSLPLLLNQCGVNFNLHDLLIRTDNEMTTIRKYLLHAIQAIVFFGGFGTVSCSVYYIDRLRKIDREEDCEKSRPVGERRKTDVSGKAKEKEKEKEKAKEDKYDELYERIVAYMETERAYVIPDFVISQLAIALNTNIAYVSLAIRRKRGINFNLFLNTYRIENVKKLLQDDAQKYTLEHVYTTSGFQNQSTFNKAFKACEGVTPTEYIKSKALREAAHSK
jgi:AraC-like DNA-binding protein